MKTLIRLLFVSVAALVTMFLAASCAEYGAPGTVNGGVAPAPRNDNVSGLPWNGPRPGPDAARYGGLTGQASTQVAPSRPGLATTAGYEREAPVQTGWFHRKSSDVPDATDSFHYNDEEGAKAMMDALDGSSRHSGLFSAAGDRLRVDLQAGEDDLPWLEADHLRQAERVVIGQAGDHFSIHLKNTTKHRLEIVTSVDGLDVLDGKAASIRKHGYVLEPHQEYLIQGFRKNEETVKQFMFGSVNHSEASKKGEARNVGVIGLAVYEEDEAAARAAQLAEAFKRSGASAFPRN